MSAATSVSPPSGPPTDTAAAATANPSFSNAVPTTTSSANANTNTNGNTSANANINTILTAAAAAAAAAAPPKQISQPPLPPPQTFDILPPLHALLSRLEPSLNTYTTDSTPSDQPLQHQPQAATTISSASTNNIQPQIQASHQSQEQLSYKDLVTNAQFLKARMRKALVELGRLGDMERGVGEQELEVGELEARIRGQRAVLGELGRRAREGERELVGGGAEG